MTIVSEMRACQDEILREHRWDFSPIVQSVQCFSEGFSSCARFCFFPPFFSDFVAIAVPRQIASTTTLPSACARS